jgi:hypothetical protein
VKGLIIKTCSPDNEPVKDNFVGTVVSRSDELTYRDTAIRFGRIFALFDANLEPQRVLDFSQTACCARNVCMFRTLLRVLLLEYESKHEIIVKVYAVVL